MHTLGKLIKTYRNDEDQLCAVFSIENEDIEHLLTSKSDEMLKIDIKKAEKGRSLEANKYFWKMCSLIGQKIGCTKDQIYLLMLDEAGVFYDLEFSEAAYEEGISKLKGIFRLVEDRGIQNGMHKIRCYVGSHTYSTSEMSKLIQRTVDRCHELDIDTYSKYELDIILKNWSEGGN